MAVSAVQCLSSFCFAIPCKIRWPSLSASPSSPTHFNFTSISSLSSSSTLSSNFLSRGCLSMRRTLKPVNPIVCQAAANKKPDSAAKRVRQAEKRRMRNKSRKSEVKTRMRKVLKALDQLKVRAGAQSEEVLPIEKLIGEAYSAIDKAVRKGTLHRNTGARRKSRLARRKKAVAIHHGWYTPVAPADPQPV